MQIKLTRVWRVRGKRIMAIEIKVPDIGTDEVEITEILVKVGDKAEAEQSLIARRRQSLYGSPVLAGWRRKRSKSCRRQNRETGALIMISIRRR